MSSSSISRATAARKALMSMPQGSLLARPNWCSAWPSTRHASHPMYRQMAATPRWYESSCTAGHGSPWLSLAASTPINWLLPEPYSGESLRTSRNSTWLHLPDAPTHHSPDRDRYSCEIGAGADGDPVSHSTRVSPASLDLRDPAVAWQMIPVSCRGPVAASMPKSVYPRVFHLGYSCTVSPALRSTSGNQSRRMSAPRTGPRLALWCRK